MSGEEEKKRLEQNTSGEATNATNEANKSASSSSKKKKNKGKSNTNAETTSKQVPEPSKPDQAVLEAVKEKLSSASTAAGASSSSSSSAQSSEQLSPEAVAEIMRLTKLQDYLQGKSGPMGKNEKDMGNYKFWNTQPVVRLDSDPNEIKEGALEPDKDASEIRQTPYPLPKDFEWVSMDLDKEDEVKEVYELLTHNYVEDNDASFRFDYSADFFKWALKPPGFKRDWHVGVRVTSTRRLVAFIAGIPMSIRAHDITNHKTVEINFMCIHKKLRSKRLAPVLIKEITRRCHQVNVFQAIYTGGVFLPTPVAKTQYFHRSLNPKKLVATGFAMVPRGSTLAQMIKRDSVPSSTSIPGLRPIRESDAPALLELLKTYMSRFELACGWTCEDIQHTFISQDGNVTFTYVVENDQGFLTDFFSFYSLPSTALQTADQAKINAAYLSYYATTTAPACNHLASTNTCSSSSSTNDPVPKPATISWDKETPEQIKSLKERLVQLIGDALIIANQNKFDVFNALTVMDNKLFLDDLQFGPGDGYLHWYLYNWAVRPIKGGLPEEVGGLEHGENRSGVGMTML